MVNLYPNFLNFCQNLTMQKLNLIYLKTKEYLNNNDFPDDSMRWPLHNINKHIKACEDKLTSNI